MMNVISLYKGGKSLNKSSKEYKLLLRKPIYKTTLLTMLLNADIIKINK